MTPTQTVLGIHLPASDTHFPEMIRKGPLVDGRGTYQLNKFNAAMPHVRHKGIAVDVGAHVGLWTMQLAKAFQHVHAFEMLPAHIECLTSNCAHLPNVTIYEEAALGSGLGYTSFIVESGNSGNTRVNPKARPSGYTTALRPLDYYFPPDSPNVDFLKIDVEGYEMQVVVGATATIKRCRPTMVVEQKRGHAERYGGRTGEVIELLEAWGARTVWEKAGDFCLTWHRRE